MSGNQISSTASQPTPTGGMNALTSLASMPPDDAIVLLNMFPNQYGVEVRHGSIEWATLPTPDKIQTLMAFAGVSAKLYAASGSVLYEITSHIPVSIVTGLGSAIFSFINFANTAGLWMVAVNGVDDPIVFDGTATIRRLVAGNGVTPYTISGVNPRAFSFVQSHDRRLWFAEVNTTNGWYLPPDAVYGHATQYDFGPVFKRGGTLMILATWTVDSGTGMNDKLVAISDRGEAALYSGTDPSSLSTWNFEGVFYIGAPLSNRSAIAYGAELLIMTQQGLTSFSNIIVSTTLNPLESLISNKIQLLISNFASNFQQFFGWMVRINYLDNEVIVNVPGASVDNVIEPTIAPPFSRAANLDSATSVQLVMNMVTGSWSAYVGIDPFTMVSWDGNQAFSTTNVVYKWGFGTLDHVAADGTGGTPIPFEALQSFSYAGAPGTLKHVKMGRPTFMTDNTLNYGLQIETDFQFRPFTAQIESIPTANSLWGSAIWGVDYWPIQAGTVLRSWVNCPSIGFALAIHVKGTSYGKTNWIVTDLIAEAGGPDMMHIGRTTEVDKMVLEQTGYYYGEGTAFISLIKDDIIQAVFVLFDYRQHGKDSRCATVEMTLVTGNDRTWMQRESLFSAVQKCFELMPVSRINCFVPVNNKASADRAAKFIPLRYEGIMEHWYGPGKHAASYYYFFGDFSHVG